MEKVPVTCVSLFETTGPSYNTKHLRLKNDPWSTLVHCSLRSITTLDFFPSTSVWGVLEFCYFDVNKVRLIMFLESIFDLYYYIYLKNNLNVREKVM